MTNLLRSTARGACVLLLGAASLTILPRAFGAEEVLITEFMASNNRTLMDRDREFSDWIELHNAGSESVNLGGWHLTDKADQRNRWVFPETTLAPGGYLVVFASGKDRRVAGQELHTNFKLGAEGGYLALVKPDGRSVASQYAPTYPPQVPDVSYGLSFRDPTRVLVPLTAPNRTLVPSSEPGGRWTQTDFDDSSWSPGSGGVGFDSANEFAGLLGVNLRDSMLGRNASVFLRVPFELADPRLDSLKLRVRYDDGFVAYLNGKEIARRNAPAELRWDSRAAGERRSAPTVFLAENFESTESSYQLLQTTPKMRSRVNTGPAGASGKFLRLVNGQADNQVNAVTLNRTFNPGGDPVLIDFDFRFKNAADAPGRLSLMLIPVGAYPTNGSGISLESYDVRRHADFPGVLAVEIRPGHSRRTVCVHVGQSSGSEDNGPVSSRIDLAARELHHVQIQIKPVPNGATLTVNLSPSGGSKQTAIHDAFIPGLKLSAGRLQFAAQIGTWDNTVDLANIRVQTAEGGGLHSDEFDLASQLGILRQGRNVLALQGLNSSADDRAFLLAPELVGRSKAGGTNAPGYFLQPTPRGTNKQAFATIARPPVFSRKGGVLTNAISLELKAKSGSIRYTLDGTEPTANSSAYTAPLRISESGLVKARTFEEGAVPSPVVTEAYTLLDETAAGFSSNLPLVVINPYGRYIRHGSRTIAYVTVIDGGNRSSPGGPVDFHGASEMNIRGFSSLRQPKHSYTLRTRDDAGSKLKASILGMPRHSDWVLFAPYSDKTLMRDVLAYELSRKMGRYAPRTRFVEVFMANRTGKVGRRDYLGVYILMEKIERGKDRVNIQQLTPADNAEPGITGGYIFKRDHSDDENPDFHTSRGSGMFMVEPSPRDITREQRAWISRYMNEVERSIYGANFKDPEAGYTRYLDVDSFIDQHWLIEMSKNIDGFRYSVFFTKDRGGKLQVQPVWDWNLSFGNANYHDGDDPNGWYTDRLRTSEICWFRRLNQDPEFAQRAIDRWSALRRDVFSVPNIFRRIDEIAARLNESQGRNFQRWPIMGREVWPNSYVGSNYQEEVNWMKKWIQQRITWIDGQLPPLPVLVGSDKPGKASDTITLRNSRGKIYYTLDGTDPRQPGGAIAPNAQLYKAPIPVNAGTRLFARSNNDGTWSAPLHTKAPDSPKPVD